MKKAIIIGASSGIGKELAILLANRDYELGLVARRLNLLEDLQKEIPSKTSIEQVDISHIPDTIEKITQMIQQMGDVDLIIINAGIGFINPELDWHKEEQTIAVNVNGFCALAGLAYHYFEKRGQGHLVGISSISALKGNDIAPAYSASKAFMSNYLEALQKKAFKQDIPIIITDIKPGFVDTEMAKGKRKFWVASPTKAAEQIFAAIQHRKLHAYITRRWSLIGWLLKIVPFSIFKRI